MFTRALSLLALFATLSGPALAEPEERPARATGIQPIAADATQPSSTAVRKIVPTEPSAGTPDGIDDEYRLDPDPADLEIWWRRNQRALARHQ